jgi:U3 small nucleolar RNA-associated protein 22
MEANQFRSFWGEKSEIRRFNDGSISESILWCPATAPFGEKRLIVQKIVVYLLQNHFNIIASKIHYIASQFDITIRNINNELNETNEEKCREIIQIFDELSKNLRSMKDLPLEIVSVTGLDSTFRYTDPTPPTLDAEFVSKGKLTKDLKGYFRAQKVVNGLIQLSSSSKWPDDEDAQQRLKAAFYLDIEKRMKTEFPGMYKNSNENNFFEKS